MTLLIILFDFLAAKKRGIEGGASGDVASLVSHAVQEYLRTLMEELAIAASHRLENFKVSGQYLQDDNVHQLANCHHLHIMMRLTQLRPILNKGQLGG